MTSAKFFFTNYSLAYATSIHHVQWQSVRYVLLWTLLKMYSNKQTWVLYNTLQTHNLLSEEVMWEERLFICLQSQVFWGWIESHVILCAPQMQLKCPCLTSCVHWPEIFNNHLQATFREIHKTPSKKEISVSSLSFAKMQLTSTFGAPCTRQWVRVPCLSTAACLLLPLRWKLQLFTALHSTEYNVKSNLLLALRASEIRASLCP